MCRACCYTAAACTFRFRTGCQSSPYTWAARRASTSAGTNGLEGSRETPFAYLTATQFPAFRFAAIASTTNCGNNGTVTSTQVETSGLKRVAAVMDSRRTSPALEGKGPEPPYEVENVLAIGSVPTNKAAKQAQLSPCNLYLLSSRPLLYPT